MGGNTFVSASGCAIVLPSLIFVRTKRTAFSTVLFPAARATIGPAAARELCLTGRVIGAEEALRLGVVSEVHPDEELREGALELAKRISEMPRAAQAETKRRILLDAEHAFGDLFAEEERVFRETLLEIEPDPAA